MILFHRPQRVRPECVAISKARPDMSEAEKLAAKMEPKLAKAFLKLLSAMQEAVDLNALADALQKGDVAKVMSLIGEVDLGEAVDEVDQALTEALWGGGALAAAQINARITAAYFAFDKLNPRLIEWLKAYKLNLIRQITSETREAIRDKLITGMTAGSNPVKVAREIKGAIGLTARQQKAVSNFRAQLEGFHERKGAKGWNLGGKIDRVNGRQVLKPSADGTPKDGIDERRLRDFRFDGQLQRAMETGKPLSQAQIDKMVAAYERKYLRYRSEVIARTEALRTTNYGVQDAWRQAIEDGKVVEAQTRRMWIVSKDERLCAVCQPVPGMNPKKGVAFGQPFATPKGPAMLPPLHPNCLPAGALVSSGCGISGATARWYQGELAVIRTASGQELSATPNHPVLTRSGWVGVGLLQKGDHVVRRTAPERIVARGKHHENMPARIEEVARALLQSPEMATAEMPVSAEHFHGDGAGSEVAVVGAYRNLSGGLDPTLGQHPLKALFEVALKGWREALSRLGDLLSVSLRVRPAPRCAMCGGDLGGSLDFAHRAPLGALGFGSPPQRHPSAPQGPADGGAADVELARQIIDGATGPIAFDEVLEVRRVPFAGHVFNLETTHGHYTANGLISHNCRCTVYIRQWEAEQLADG